MDKEMEKIGQMVTKAADNMLKVRQFFGKDRTVRVGNF